MVLRKDISLKRAYLVAADYEKQIDSMEQVLGLPNSQGQKFVYSWVSFASHSLLSDKVPIVRQKSWYLVDVSGAASHYLREEA